MRSSSLRPTLWTISWGLTLGLAGGALPTLAESGTGPTAARPILEVVKTAKSAGEVEQGAVAHYTFTVWNRGQADLQIRQVKPSCGCSVAKWERVVKPDSRSEIVVDMETEYFRGSVSKHLTLFSDDPDRPQLDLTISARVVPPVWIKPGPAAVLPVSDRPAVQDFVLERNRGRPLKIIQILTGAPYVTADATPLPGKGRFRVRVTATPAAPLGRTRVPVTVKTDLEQAGTIALELTVDRGIVAEPPIIFYGLLPAEIKAPAQATVALIGHAAPFHIKSLAVDEPQLTTHLETIHEGSEYRVTVTYTGGWNTGLKKTMLTVTTDDPTQTAIRIPIQAIIQTKVSTLPASAR